MPLRRRARRAGSSGSSGDTAGDGSGVEGSAVLPRPRRLEVGAKYDPAPLRERTRSRLAAALVALLATISLLLVVGAAFRWFSVAEAKDLAVAVLTPLIAITGTALGFYFGGNKDS